MIDSTTSEAPADLALVCRAKSGDRDALETLVRAHQTWIYNLALRMLYDPHDAEDLTQEVLVKIVTKLSSFEGRSAFRTWAYRIAVNHILTMKRSPMEADVSFDRFGQTLDATPDSELSASDNYPVELPLLLKEARIGCTIGMLLCLDRRQRLVFILGEVMQTNDQIGAEVMDTTPANFRQLLTRARRDLYGFMQNKCRLVNTSNPCRCEKKTRGFIDAGYVDPHHLKFAHEHVRHTELIAPSHLGNLDELESQYARIYQEHPTFRPADFAKRICELLSTTAMLSD